MLGTQIVIDKLFSKFPLKCKKNAENKDWSFNLHLPQAYERAIGTLIKYSHMDRWLVTASFWLCLYRSKMYSRKTL